MLYNTPTLSLVARDLYIGTIENAKYLLWDNPNGIEAVVNVSGEEYDQNPNITYLNVPLEDGKSIPKDKFDTCMKFLADCDAKEMPTLVHCHIGASRSPVIAASHMLKLRQKKYPEKEFTLEGVLSLIKMVRPMILPSPALIRSAKVLLGLFPYNEGVS